MKKIKCNRKTKKVTLPCEDYPRKIYIHKTELDVMYAFIDKNNSGNSVSYVKEEVVSEMRKKIKILNQQVDQLTGGLK